MSGKSRAAGRQIVTCWLARVCRQQAKRRWKPRAPVAPWDVVIEGKEREHALPASFRSEGIAPDHLYMAHATKIPINTLLNRHGIGRLDNTFLRRKEKLVTGKTKNKGFVFLHATQGESVEQLAVETRAKNGKRDNGDCTVFSF